MHAVPNGKGTGGPSEHPPSPLPEPGFLLQAVSRICHSAAGKGFLFLLLGGSRDVRILLRVVK